MTTPERGPCPIDLETLSKAVREAASPTTPSPLRLRAARGAVPMGARDLVTAQFILTFDADAKVAEHAEASLVQLDPTIANAVLGDATLSPHVLGHLARVHAAREAYIDKLLLNPSTPDEVFPEVALRCSESTAETIAGNQARLLRQPDIVRALLQNARVPKSTRDRVVDFLIREGVVLEHPAFEERLLELDDRERAEAASRIELPPELLDDRSSSAEQRSLIADDGVTAEDGRKVPLEERLRLMNLSEQVALATRGNRSVRRLLLRSTNRLVALAAATSPLLQEPDVLEAANSKTTHQDALTHFATDRKKNWVRSYQVKSALITNPKTPQSESMRLVPYLNKKDLKDLSRNRNVPTAVRNMAANLTRPDRR